MDLPAPTWARILRFAGEAGPAATAHCVREAVPLCLAELGKKAGVAAFLSTASSPSLPDAFAAFTLFPHDEEVGGHFSQRRQVVTAYLRTAATSTQRSLAHFATYLFERPALDPLVRRGQAVPRMLSFGLVRKTGWQLAQGLAGPGAQDLAGPRLWECSRATTDALAKDLMVALHGVARAHLPSTFPYLWTHISRAETPRRKFMFPRNSFVVSLPEGRRFHMPPGAVARGELCELETMVSFNVPLEPHEVPVESTPVLENAGFNFAVRCRAGII